MNFINLTPHSITLFTEENERIYIPASGKILRMISGIIPRVWDQKGIPVLVEEYVTETQTFPNMNLEQKENTAYLVSQPCLWYYRGRHDVFAPNTNPHSVVRDEKGSVVGVKRLLSACVSITYTRRDG